MLPLVSPTVDQSGGNHRNPSLAELISPAQVVQFDSECMTNIRPIGMAIPGAGGRTLRARLGRLMQTEPAYRFSGKSWGEALDCYRNKKLLRQKIAALRPLTQCGIVAKLCPIS